MKLIDFKQLPLSDQLNILYRNGVYIGKIRSDDKILVGYQLDSFYVEVVYLTYRLHVEMTIAFDSVSRIYRYLEQVEVEIPVL
jgi:hypothetical protein